MNTVIGIPARYASTRFPGKPLASLAGRPMILHVVERALLVDIGRVFVATDDERIASVVEGSGAEVVMTPDSCSSGTERLACAVREMACDIVVNLQGDEPLIDPAAIRAVVEPFRREPDLPMATLAHSIREEFDFNQPDVVKVVCNAAGHAMYFSRSPIPYMRTESATPLQHVGLYAYRREFLLHYPSLEPSPAELAEQLEQLRVLHHGYSIAVTSGDFECIGIDTPEDLVRAEAMLARQP